MRVVDRHKWFRFKSIVTVVMVLLTLGSVGGLEGEGEIPSHAWFLLFATGLMVVHVTNYYGKEK